jgi:CCR4-NOT transcription complex subunit 1
VTSGVLWLTVVCLFLFQEPNHHVLYTELIEGMKDKELAKVVLRTTYYYSKALLDSERAITQTNERTLIKQLGAWLGLQTFAQNKPVLAKDMDFKAMITDAYQRGRMIAVLPFVEKVLAGCKQSKVFKANNPMIHGILALLAEIHGMERLKLNISFVIELTFKTFDVLLVDIIPSTTLKDLERQMLHNPDFSALPEASKMPGPVPGAPLPSLTGPLPPLTPPTSTAAGGAGAAASPGAALPPVPGTPQPSVPPSQAAAAPQGTPGGAAAQQQGAAPGAASPAAAAGAPGAQQPSPGEAAAPGGAGAAASPAQAATTAAVSPGPAAAAAGGVAAEQGLYAKLHSYVQISPNLMMLSERLQLKRLVPMAVDRAICEIITPVVERSVTIACMTTYELVTKDYATDPDESRLRAAAHAMVSSLAGSLALVTCKEPLKVSLGSQLRVMLQQQVDPNMLEQAVQVGGKGLCWQG